MSTILQHPSFFLEIKLSLVLAGRATARLFALDASCVGILDQAPLLPNDLAWVLILSRQLAHHVLVLRPFNPLALPVAGQKHFGVGSELPMGGPTGELTLAEEAKLAAT